MALQNYPVPDLDVTLQEASRVLKLRLSPDHHAEFEGIAKQQRASLEEVHQKLAAAAEGQENWVTDLFKKGLLSCAEPLPYSTARPSLLTNRTKRSNQLERAASLLWAAAKLYSEPSLLPGYATMEGTQQSETFATSRIPGKDQDEIKTYPDSLHVIVICVGGVFPVDILCRSSPGGPRSPKPFNKIYNQLSNVMAQQIACKEDDPLVICSLSSMNRRSWAAKREEIIQQGGEAAASLELMESAVLTLCLEDYNAPPDRGDTLKALKLGREGGGPCLRYYDKVLNIVMFKDCTAGLLVEHTVIDGLVAVLLSDVLYNLSESDGLVHTDAQHLNGPTTLKKDIATLCSALKFPLQGINTTISPLGRKAADPIVSFDFCSYPDAFSALRGVRGLYDAWITFSLQLSLSQILGESFVDHLFVTPTHMRHFKHGRSDPTYSLTFQALKLVDALSSCIGKDNRNQYTTHLLHLFHEAFGEHKRLIKNTKYGHGVGPHIGILRRSLPSEHPLKRFLEIFGCPSIYLTGVDQLWGLECGTGNVYAKDQLAVSYVGHKDKVAIQLIGKGKFVLVLEELQGSMMDNLKLVMALALRYAVANQMGALGCLLEKAQDKSPKVSTSTVDSTSSTNSNCALVIHGGAGEEMMLSTEVIGVIEFALQTAVTLGSLVLHQGGRSLDAVQRSVEALKDCFLFNAGKGSVFSKDGNNEMEASIIDGSARMSGSAACLRSVKNPIKAARSIMEKSSHPLITGDGAEEFLHGPEGMEKPVGPEYFYTDMRRRQLDAKLSSGNNVKGNHPQTVGAVALDHRRELAAASSTGGVVGKLKGRVGDTAVVGAGLFADDKVSITCSGDGDVFLRHTVSQKIASLYHHKGYSLRQACREVMEENLNGVSSGIIAVDAKGDAVIESNAGVMFVASMVNGVSRVEVRRPLKRFTNVIWETDEMVAYLDPNPWIPGSTILTRKTVNGASDIYKLPVPDFVAMLEGARTVASLLCERLSVQRCALVCNPLPKQPVQIRLLPLHGLTQEWQAHIASEEEYHPHHPGYCTSKNGPRWDEVSLTQVQEKIKKASLTPDALPCFDFFGDPSDGNLFSRFVRGELQQWRVWEDGEHIAFLTPFPNSPGFTVVVPRKPLSSDIFQLEDADFKAMILATYKVAQLLEEGMGASGIALIFEGFEIDYAHAKLIPVLRPPGGSITSELPHECFQSYPGYVSSLSGPVADPEALKEIHLQITQCKPPRSWEDPQSHSTLAMNSQWYHNIFQLHDTLFHSTVEYFQSKCHYCYALTTETISSPMGLGSDSEPVRVNLLGHDTNLSDSMQFVLEYILRFKDNVPGTYYISSSFRGEDTDATHLNQFYHVECELLGDLDKAIAIAEGYVAHLTNSMLKKHSDIILNMAGTLTHVTEMLSKLDGKTPLPRIPLDHAIPMMPTADCLEWVLDGHPEFGRKITRRGEEVLMEKYGGAVWLTEMDHLAVPFYQAYMEGTGRGKAKAADLLIGLGETVGLGERHSTPEQVQEAVKHHSVPEQSYKWYIDMRTVKPLHTSGWGMGTERYLCWLLRHNDVRDMHIIPRMKGMTFMP